MNEPADWRPSRRAARSSSPPARAPARRPCSSSGSCARSATTGSTSSRCSSSPTRARPPASCARASARRCTRAAAHDLARRLDGAWISTIHGFCSRLLRTHPFAVGLDPRFHELADEQAAVLRGEAFERALASFCASRDPERLRLLATYGAQGLRRMLTGVYETLRSAGRDLTLELGERAGVAGAARRAAGGGARASRPTPPRPTSQLAAANVGARARLESRSSCSTSPSSRRPATACGRVPRGARPAAAGGARGARGARQRAAAGAARPVRHRVPGVEGSASRRSTSRTCSSTRATSCATTSTIRVAEQLRFRSIMVDEFQDTNRLQCHIVDLLARRAGRAGRLLRRRRVPVDLRLPARRRRRLPRAARGRGAAAAAGAQLPLAARGARRRQPPLPRGVRRRATSRWPRPASSRIPSSVIRRAARRRQGELSRSRRAVA